MNMRALESFQACLATWQSFNLLSSSGASTFRDPNLSSTYQQFIQILFIGLRLLIIIIFKPLSKKFRHLQPPVF